MNVTKNTTNLIKISNFNVKPLEVFNFQDFINKVCWTEWSIANRKIMTFFSILSCRHKTFDVGQFIWMPCFAWIQNAPHLWHRCGDVELTEILIIKKTEYPSVVSFSVGNKSNPCIWVHQTSDRLRWVQFTCSLSCRVWFLYQEMRHISCSCKIFSSWINCTGFWFTWC